MNSAQMLCAARVLGVVCLRGDVAEKLLKIVQVEGDDNCGTVGRDDSNSAFEVAADESMVEDQLSLMVGQPDRNPLTRLDASYGSFAFSLARSNDGAFSGEQPTAGSEGGDRPPATPWLDGVES